MKKEKFTKLSTLQSDTGGHMMLLAPVTIFKVLQFHSVFSLVLNAKTKKNKKTVSALEQRIKLHYRTKYAKNGNV